MGVYPKSWRQVMVPEMPVTTLDISALHGFLCWVFDAEVKESCSWLAVVASLLPFYPASRFVPTRLDLTQIDSTHHDFTRKRWILTAMHLSPKKIWRCNSFCEHVVGKVGCPWLVWKQNQQFQWYMVFSTDCKKKLLWLRWHQATKIQHCPNTSVNIEIAIKSKCLSLVRPVKHQGQYFGMAHACRTSGLEFSGSSLSCARRGASTTVPTK